MQLVDGTGLEKIIQRLREQRTKRRSSRKSRIVSPPSGFSLEPDAWRGFAKLIEQVARTLEYAHSRNVLHNDIKPSNLLVRPQGQVILTDFGIGRPDGNELADADDHEVGTLRYMAPERWNGKKSPQSDIYSLGVTLYELVTQTPIFDFPKRSQIVNAILHQDPPPPRRIRPDLPVPLERILLKAIAKTPLERYATALELSEDLRRFMNRQPIHAAKPDLLRRVRTWWEQWLNRWKPRGR